MYVFSDRLMEGQKLLFKKGYYLRSAWNAMVDHQGLHEGFGFRKKGRRDFMSRAESMAGTVRDLAKQSEVWLRTQRKDVDPQAEEKDIHRGRCCARFCDEFMCV